MTALTHFQVEPGQIRAHADTVGDIAGQLSSVTSGLPDGMADNSLGTFVQFLTAGLQEAMNQTTEAIAHASSTMDHTKAGLARTADGYQHTDEHSAALLRQEDR